MILSLYRLFGTLGGPVISFYMNRRKARGKEDLARFNERLGRSDRERPSGPLVWLHAASVGESISLLPLIERITEEKPEIRCLLTTGTVTSAALMVERLPKTVIHHYVPIDRPSYVARFFDHWKPDLVLWSESDFWPNLLREPVRRGIPLVLINGRISPKSFKGWQRFSGLAKELVGGFSLCLAQTPLDADRLSALGASNGRCVGNLKFAVKPLPAEETSLQNLKSQFADRTRWFCASTHPGEEEILWRVHQRVATGYPDLVTVIAPRHPNRGDEIAATLRAQGAVVGQRSKGDEITADTQIYVADTLGEMGLFFRACQLVFMGKSFVDKGGQNPLEAASLECTILHGPYMWNFQEIVDQLAAHDASRPVADEDALVTALAGFLASPETALILAANAKAYVNAQAGVIDAVYAEVRPYLEAASARGDLP